MDLISKGFPALTESQSLELTKLATTFALSNGLLYLPPTPASGSLPDVPTAAVHAPFSLIPSPFPRTLFERAFKLQRVCSILYARIAMDRQFLDEVMGPIAQSGMDDFTKGLWESWHAVRDDEVQPFQLGLFRSDYLLHQPDKNAEITIKQVEFNTISSSFGALSDRVSELHEYLRKCTSYFNISQTLFDAGNYPTNQASVELVRGMIEAHKVYGAENAKILFVVQDNERNVFDQKLLEYELLRHGIVTIRQTPTQLLKSASLSTSQNLIVSDMMYPGESIEVSVVYFRSTYTPSDFPTQEYWDMRVLIERSRAIKCPSLNLQMAGGKKVQQILMKPGVLEKFLHDVEPGVVEEIRNSWVDMWGLGDPSTDGKLDGMERCYQESHRLVLKPQREGGGNNIYRAAIPPFLDEMRSTSPEQKHAWVAMELIQPPMVEGIMVRDGKTVRGGVISELGTFGWCLFAAGTSSSSHASTVASQPLREETIMQRDALDDSTARGYLLRSKGVDSDEGGVAVGWSVLDSVILV